MFWNQVEDVQNSAGGVCGLCARGSPGHGLLHTLTCLPIHSLPLTIVTSLKCPIVSIGCYSNPLKSHNQFYMVPTFSVLSRNSLSPENHLDNLLSLHSFLVGFLPSSNGFGTILITLISFGFRTSDSACLVFTNSSSDPCHVCV